MAPFLDDDDAMIALALLQRDTGIPTSRRLGIKDEVIAFNFDAAVSMRRWRIDTEMDEAQSKRIGYQVNKAMTGGNDN